MKLPPNSRSRSSRWSRVVALIGLAFLTTLAISACSRNDLARSGVALSAELRQDQEHGTLSREHHVTVEVPETELDMRFQHLADRCKADSAHHCTILQSDVSTGQFASGLIKLRIDPDAVEELIAFAASLGKLEHRSTKVEDLAEAIQDTRSRVDMLTNYRKQLLELQAKAATNVDAAIKIASELSTVQGSLEKASGEAAFQVKRTTTEVVTILLSVREQKAFWRPIGESFRDFFGNLSTGISQAITAVAYILPWLLVVIPGLYLVRFLWRRRGR